MTDSLFGSGRNHRTLPDSADRIPRSGNLRHFVWQISCQSKHLDVYTCTCPILVCTYDRQINHRVRSDGSSTSSSTHLSPHDISNFSRRNSSANPGSPNLPRVSIRGQALGCFGGNFQTKGRVDTELPFFEIVSVIFDKRRESRGISPNHRASRSTRLHACSHADRRQNLVYDLHRGNMSTDFRHLSRQKDLGASGGRKSRCLDHALAALIVWQQRHNGHAAAGKSCRSVSEFHRTERLGVELTGFLWLQCFYPSNGKNRSAADHKQR